MPVRLVSALALCLPIAAFAGPNPGGGLPAVADEVSEDGALRVWGQLQVWATVMDQDGDEVADPSTYGDPELDPGFNLPRARFGIGGLLPPSTEKIQVRYGLSVGVSSPYDLLSDDETDLQIVDAWGQVVLANGFGPTALRAGVQKVPFGRERLISSKDLLFQERAVSTQHLAPDYDAGATLAQGIDLGDSGTVAVRLGAFNGNESFLGDDDPGLLLAARAELAIGDAYQTWSQKLDPAIGVGASIANNDQLATDTTALGGDLLARFKWFTVLGEYTRAGVRPGDSNLADPAVSVDIAKSGLTAQLSFFAPVGDRGGPEIGARYATFDDDADADNLGDVQILHAGLTWRNLLPDVDLGGGYVHREEGGNRDIANDSVRLWLQVRPSVRVIGND